MELLDLIQMADSAPQVLGLLAVYVDTLREAAAFPDWWLKAPLHDPEQARQRMVELMGIVNLASMRLDHRGCAAAKEALHVFATAVWKLGKRRGAARPPDADTA